MVAAVTLEIVSADAPDGPAIAWVPIADTFLLSCREGSDKEMKAVVDRLGKQCRSEEPLAREQAFIALGEIKHPAAVDVLVNEFLQPDDKRSGNPDRAMRAMENWVADPRVSAALVKYLDSRHGSQSSDADDACRLLGRCNQPDAHAALLRLAERETGPVRTTAVYALAHVDKQQALPVLRRLLASTKPTDLVRPALAEVLCEHGEPFDRQWVLELVRTWPGIHQTYYGAVTVIGRHGDLADARALAGCLRDDAGRETSALNSDIIQAIVQLGGPRYPYKWLESDKFLNDRELVARNRQSMDAYRAWGREPAKK